RHLLLLGVACVGSTGLMTLSARAATDTPSYQSSIKVESQRHGRERDEAAAYAGLAKIDAAQAIATAQSRVTGKVLHTGLESENGNLVYSVEIQPGQAGSPVQ